MLTFKLRPATVIAAVVLAMVFAVPSSTALASAKSCQQKANTPFTTCSHVNGRGLHINYLQGSVFNGGNRDESGVHIQLTRPSGATIKNCRSATIGPLQTIRCTWSPHRNEPAGNYCATSWQRVGGSFIERGHACVRVTR